MVPCEITHAHRRPHAGAAADVDHAFPGFDSGDVADRTAGERVDSVPEAGLRGLYVGSDR